MILRYALSSAEFVEAQYAYRMRMAKDRLLFRNLHGLACIFFVLALKAQLSRSPRLGGALFLVGAAFVLYRSVLWRVRAAAKYRDDPALPETVELQIDESHLVLATSAGSEEIRWANIDACHEAKNTFLVRHDSNKLLIIPKRAFSPGDVFHFKELRQKELIVATTRRNPDAMLLRFVVVWGVLAVAVIALFIGAIDNFLSQIPGARRASSPYYINNTVPVKSAPAAASELRGRGTVYLTPLGTRNVSLEKLIDEFHKRYGLEIHLLPAIQIPSWAINKERTQLVAEDAVTAMKLSYPQLAADPAAILVGITNGSMYIQQLSWKYAFSFRSDERFAVISTAELGEDSDGRKAVDAETRQKRTLKVLLRDVGILHYRLQPSNDETSILYQYVNDVDDLDEAGEAYLASDTQVRADLHVESGDPCFILRHYADPSREHVETPSISECSGYYKELGLETVQIDLRYGLLLAQRSDFLTADRLPLELTRVLRTQDSRSRAFGIGATHNLNVFLVGNSWPFTWLDLVLEHGGRSHFRRSNWGFGYWDALYTNRDGKGSQFNGSRIKWAWPGWALQRGGTTYTFPDGSGAVRPEQTALSSIQGFNNARISLDRDPAGNLLHARSSFGEELSFTYDSANRVTDIAQKNGGHLQYSYDPNGHLGRVTDTNQRVTEYDYDSSGRIERIAQNGVAICTLKYDQSDCVEFETLADGRTYQFTYSRGGIDIADSAGPSRRVQMYGSEYTLDVRAKGEK